ncbi:hypothetical protein PUNSTDRAFT_50263 [Punctularia strigosozonata HHB-11173 SS5]|uniref:uncharacterized protein n=1 Tax=Punctularia strigosozonata (strain HHB-11173) TaxID=741275 RepID=UPI00044174E6|nr:uncharacterized protein PUNSTDRAFT_50263 [Punctularia strigosozonata HHB-11173 SS5]EIN11173.1 hypothetical protein PUNSTDRAFT_50263 [Punctularia strigosozonata HHB-11173 SS5]
MRSSLIPTQTRYAVCEAINTNILPAVESFEDEETRYVDCTASAPEFAVTINSVQSSVSGKGNNLPPGADEKGKQLCISGTQDGAEEEDGEIFILT